MKPTATKQPLLTSFFKPKSATTTTTAPAPAPAPAPTTTTTALEVVVDTPRNNNNSNDEVDLTKEENTKNNNVVPTVDTLKKESGGRRERNQEEEEENNQEKPKQQQNVAADAAPQQQKQEKKKEEKKEQQQQEEGNYFATFGELVDTLPVPNATSIAQLFQDPEEGTSFFTKVLNHSLTIWKADTPCTYHFWTDVLADVSATSSRNLVLRRLTYGMLVILIRGTAQDLIHAFYLCINEVAAAHEGVELGIGDATLKSVISEMCGMTMQTLNKKYSQCGDLAEIAQTSKKNQVTLCAPKRLLLGDVFNTFKKIAITTGNKTQQQRADLIKRLLRDAVGAEVNFVVRALQGKMRIGVALSSLISALGFALALYRILDEHTDLSTSTINDLVQIKRAPWHAVNKNIEPAQLQALLIHYAESVSMAYHQCPCIEEVIPTIFSVGKNALPEKWLPKLQIRVGIPVKPMLAHPTTSIRHLLERFSGKAFTCEFKYDGERGQVHYDKSCPSRPFSMYSRNSESYTTKFPDVIQGLPKAFDNDEVTSFIMDGEVVAVEAETGRLRPFQVLQHRGKKNVQIENITCQVRYFAFDLLMLNGESLLNLPLRRRREILRTTFKECAMLGYAKNQDSSDVEDIQTFLETSVQEGCEGLMVKTLDEEAMYTPFKRSYHWLKLKKDYMEGVGDTLDLVPVGAYLGKGKRTGVYGGFLLACYNQDTDEYQSICKIGTGFKDDDLEKLAEQLRPTVIQRAPVHVPDVLKPDVWFTPTYVWEVRAADLSISPVHSAACGIVDPSKGIALRFPRFIKQREDKQTTDATSSDQVAQMYRAQALVAADNTGGNNDEDW